MTMRKLAELAGVSVSTVSKAFSGSKEVSAQQRKHIFELAKENGCFEKYYKALPGKPVIAVISPEYQSVYYAHQFALLEREIRARGAMMLAGCYNFDTEELRELYDYYAQHVKVDGMILYRDIPNAHPAVPTVVIGKSTKADSITISWEGPIAQMLDLLGKNGHKEIAYIGEKNTATKRRVFEAEMKKRGLVPQIVETSVRFEAAGYEMMQKLLSQPEPPTAVLAAYDAIAVGAMKAVYEHGLGIPGDISIVGMDDVKHNPYFDVPLASVTSYNEDLCEIAVDLLFERMRNRDAKRKHVRVSAELVCRGSVGKVKK